VIHRLFAGPAETHISPAVLLAIKRIGINYLASVVHNCTFESVKWLSITCSAVTLSR